MSQLVHHSGVVRIHAEAYVAVSFCVCARDGVMASDIRVVFSTKKVAAQCRGCVTTAV